MKNIPTILGGVVLVTLIPYLICTILFTVFSFLLYLAGYDLGMSNWIGGGIFLILSMIFKN